MAEQEQPTEELDEVEAPPVGRFDIVGRLARWVGISRRRMLIGLGFGILTTSTVIAWLVLAEIIAHPEVASIEVALRALDEGEDELAHAVVTQMQEQRRLAIGDYGGPLYVLGALKAREAERHYSDDRRRADYFIASRYLNEARVIGLPAGREADGLLLLGKSLLESRQLKSGIQVLQEAMHTGARNDGEIHYLLGQAYYYSPSPRYEDCLEQTEAALADEQMSRDLLNDVLLLRARALIAEERPDEALEELGRIDSPRNPAERELVTGHAWLTKFLASLHNPDAGPGDPRILSNNALQHFAETRRIDRITTDTALDSRYLEAVTLEALGEIDAAMNILSELRREHGASPAGVVSAIERADAHIEDGEYDEAIDSYRRALSIVEDPAIYRSNLLSLKEMKSRIATAHKALLDDKQFTNAYSLVDYIIPLFSKKEQLAMRAKTLELWGDALIDQADADPAHAEADSTRTLGRLRLRESGVAYEELAELRFATPYFTDDLWSASEVYQRGQSFSKAASTIERYLKHEPQYRNALALLRLGEAYLSHNKPVHAIDAFEECLEFHGNDAASYPARLGCSRAFRLLGELDRAMELLRDNLFRSAMTPASPEWRDSLFEMGRLEIETHQYENAILTLDEAVRRYPDNHQTRHAHYMMGEAHRLAAAEPLAQLAEAQTINEKEKYGELARGHLEKALKQYGLVQNEITLLENASEPDRLMLRNCYVLRGAVLFRLDRYPEAIESYSSVSTLYQNEPFVLETLVQISHCWRRLNDNVRALGSIEQARLLLARLPPDTDFATSTNLDRDEWRQVLTSLADF